MPPARYRKEGSHKTFEPSPNGKTAAMFDITLRKNNPRDVPPTELLTDIYMPLA